MAGEVKPQAGSVPVPDPTLLTTQQLTREILSVRDHFRESIESLEKQCEANLRALRENIDTQSAGTEKENKALRQILETRLDGMDKALELLQASTDRLPMRIDEKIHSLKDIHDEKFESIGTQFELVEQRRVEQKKDTKDAVDAALTAQKEAVKEQNASFSLSIQKSESGTTKQLDQLNELIRTSNKAGDDKIIDIKERVTRIEGKGESVEKHADNTKWIVGTGLALAGVIIAFAVLIRSQSTIPAPVTQYVPQQYQQSLPVQPVKPGG